MAVDTLIDAYRGKNTPRDAGAMLVGMCRGARIPIEKLQGLLKEATAEEIVDALKDAATSAKDETTKQRMSAAAADFGKPEGLRWLGEFIRIMKATK